MEKTIQKAIGKTIHDLEVEYAYNFYRYYYDILFDIHDSIGKEDVHRFSMARFNLIYNQGIEDNDFDRAIKFAENDNDLWYCANISRVIGLILDSFGMLSKALEYHFKSLGFNQRLNDKDGLSSNNKDIGVVYWNMGNYEQALEYHNKALAIDTELNDRVALAKDYYNLSFPLYAINEKRKEALQHLSNAKTILLDFEKETGYSHPLLKDIEDRISYLNQNK